MRTVTHLVLAVTAMVLLVSGPASAQTAVEAVADHYGNISAPTTVQGGNGDGETLLVKNASSNSRKAWVRFDLTGLNPDLDADATFRFRQADIGDSYTGTLAVWALVTGFTPGGGILDTDWDEDALTWNNAPANSTASKNNFTEDAIKIGTINFNTGTEDTGYVYSINIGPLADLLQADNTVTLMISVDSQSNQNYLFNIASSEHSTLTGPELVYVPAASPDTVVAVADHYGNISAPTTVQGGNGDGETLLVKYASSNSRKAWVRFDLTGLSFDSQADTTFRFRQADIATEYTGTLAVWALNSGFTPGGGILDTDWDEDALTWNNAPANNTSSKNNFTADAIKIGTISFNTAAEDTGYVYSINIGALEDFLQADNTVTLMISVDYQSNSSPSFNIASSEHSTLTGPELVLAPPTAPNKFNAVADHYGNISSPGTVQEGNGDGETLFVKYATSNSRKAWIRFDLTDVQSPGIATFRFRQADVATEYTGALGIWALNSGFTPGGGILDTDWDEDALTWNNAPANNTSSKNAFTADATKIGVISFNTAVQGTGYVYAITVDDLSQFVQSDGSVTFMIAVDSQSNATATFGIASSEHGTIPGPELVLATGSNPQVLVVDSQTGPYYTIQSALDEAAAGDTVQVHAGVYHEHVHFVNTGTAEHPITLAGDSGAILDGSIDVSLSWTAANDIGTGVYRASVSGFVPFTVTANGKVVTSVTESKCDSPTDPYYWPDFFANGFPAYGWTGVKGVVMWHSSASELLIRFNGALNPNSMTMTAAPRQNCIAINSQNYCVISGLTIRNASDGISIANSVGTIVEDCVIGPVEWGINLESGSDSCILRNNEIFFDPYAGADPFPESSYENWEVTKRVGEYNRWAIRANQGTLGGHEIHNNLIHDHWDGINLESNSSQLAGNNVHHNYIYLTFDNAVKLSYVQEDTELHDNVIEWGRRGLRISEISSGPLFIYRNIFLETKSSGLVVYTNNSLQPAEVWVYHNTNTSDDAVYCDFGQSQDTVYVPNYHYYNNLFWCNRALGKNMAYLPNWIYSDYDIYVRARTGDRPWTSEGDTWGDSAWNTGVSNVNAVPYDQNAMWITEIGGGQTFFVDSDNRDMALCSDSRAREAGLDLSTLRGGTLPGCGSGYFSGDAPDVGALQYGESMPDLP